MKRQMIVLSALLTTTVLLTCSPHVAGDAQANDQGQDPHPARVDLQAIPRIVDELYFGVPAGNGAYPYQVAIDSARERVYTLNSGLNDGDGNTVSVFDTRQSEFIALVPLHNPGTYSPPSPIGLHVDPYRPRIYALSGDRYSDTPNTVLMVIDIDSLDVVGQIDSVETVAVGPQALYLANDNRLWTVDPISLVEQHSVDLPARKFNEPLVLNPRLSRLYLGRGDPGEVEVFDALSLVHLATTSLSTQPDQIILHEESGTLFVIQPSGDRAAVLALDADGSLLESPAPLEVRGDYYSHCPAASDGKVLYIGQGDYANYQVRGYRLPDLQLLPTAFNMRRPDHIVADSSSGILYAQYSSFGGPLLTINPNRGVIKTAYTAITVRDVLPDPENGRLYVLDEAGSLRILSSNDLKQIARVETGFGIFPDNWGEYGQMSLDRGRHRLYVDGIPARIVDTESLAVTVYPSVSGQLTPDPAGDQVYLTPRCSCRTEQCNTLVISADTMTGTQTLYPPRDPMEADCVYETFLDVSNRLLYAHISNGVPGSNGGSYFSVFDVADEPTPIYTNGSISFGQPALDSERRRAYMPRYRMDRTYLHRIESLGRTMTSTLVLAGAGGRLAYDYARNLLFSAADDVVQVFDGDLVLQSEIPVPDNYSLLDIDVPGQRLYLAGSNGQLLVVATTGGQLGLPSPPAPLSSDSVPDQTLYAAPDGTLFRSYNERLYRSDDGQTWEMLGKGLPARSVCAFAISPDFARDQTLFAGMLGYGRIGGFYRSKDGGRTWLPAMRGLTDTEICTIAISPTFARDRTVFGASYLRGLFRSTDAGDTWTWLADRYSSDGYDVSVKHLALSPAFAEDGLVILARDTLLRSVDGGNRWTDTGVPGGLVAFSPYFADDRLVLSDGTWRSADGGISWQPSAVGLEPSDYGAESIMFSPHFGTDKTVYILLRAGYEELPPLQRSVDGGRSWQELQGGLPDGFRFSAVALLPDGNLFLGAVDGSGLRVSPDRLVWSDSAAPANDIGELDIQDIAVTPDGTLLVAHNTAGVLRSTDGGRTWSAAAFPARGSTFAQARLAVADDGTIFASLGPALERSHDDGQSWEHLGDLPTGYEVTSLAVSPDFATDGVVIAGGNYSSRQIIRSADRGETWQVVFDAASIEDAAEMTSVAFSPGFARDGTAFVWLQYGGLLVSTDGGLNWSMRASEQKDMAGQSLVVSPRGDRLYLGALYGHTLMSPDNGQTWTDLRDSIPDQRVWSTSLRFDAQGMLYLATDVGIYRSPDMGTSWERASAGLPIDPQNERTQGVRALATADGLVYAALRQGGVYVSADQGASWRSTATGDPASPLATAEPTTAPSPTSVPEPTPSGPAEASDCPDRPTYFADVWSSRVSVLGCPTNAQTLSIVEQSFEGGRMFWRSDTRDIYVVPDNAPYSVYEDTWDETQPEYTCPDIYPFQTPPTPKRGFGKVWCDASNVLVRRLLGNATGDERAFSSQLQQFSAGLIFDTDRGVVYILEDQGNNWETSP